jgi:hypothetical protein
LTLFNSEEKNFSLSLLGVVEKSFLFLLNDSTISEKFTGLGSCKQPKQKNKRMIYILLMGSYYLG